MKIYTKTGDAGHTQIYAGEVVRLAKSADVLECYGTLDELNAQLGLLISQLTAHQQPQFTSLLTEVQRQLFQIGFAISATTTLQDEDVHALENAIDNMQTRLPAQTHFILPGGHILASQAHVCRTVARRAERRMVALLEEYPVPDRCLQYLNRLSDYLFVLARSLNQLFETNEITL